MNRFPPAETEFQPDNSLPTLYCQCISSCIYNQPKIFFAIFSLRRGLWFVGAAFAGIEEIDHWRHDLPATPSSTQLEPRPKVQMSPVSSSSHGMDTSKDNIYSALILIANLSSPSDYHVLESAIRNATRSTKDQLTVILHSPTFANKEDPQANWFEFQRLLTWMYVESTAVAQDMDKVLLNTDVLLRPPHVPAAAGTKEDEELVKRADAVYVFEDGAL